VRCDGTNHRDGVFLTYLLRFTCAMVISGSPSLVIFLHEQRPVGGHVCNTFAARCVSLQPPSQGQVIYQYYNVKKLYDIYINVYLYSNFYIYFIPFSLFYIHLISPLIVFNKNRTGGQSMEQGKLNTEQVNFILTTKGIPWSLLTAESILESLQMQVE
jgi:hypothetical protein